MSINSMNMLALRRGALAHAGRAPADPLEQIFAAPRPSHGPPGEAAAPTRPAAAGALEELTRYIPTETITLYLALLGVIGATSAGYTGRWVAFAIFLALTPATVWVDWLILARRAERPDRALSRRLLGFNLAAATLAFAAWGFSLPASPFAQFGWYDPKWGGFIALAASFALTKAEALFLPVER